MPGIKDTVRSVLPPVVWEAGKACFRRLPLRTNLPEWQFIPEGWDYATAHPEVRGWNVEEVLETYRQKWPHFLAMTSGSKPLGVTQESALVSREDVISHNLMMTFGYVLGRASNGGGKLRMLDWGGGIGHYCHLARQLQPGLDLEYHCKDVELLAKHGREIFPDQSFHWQDDCLEDRYDLVMASGSLQYAQDWKAMLARLATAAGSYVYITLLPTVVACPSFVLLQRAYAYGYETEYLGWCLNRQELLDAAVTSGLILEREFVVGHRPQVVGAPEQNSYRGFLFSPSTRRA